MGLRSEAGGGVDHVGQLRAKAVPEPVEGTTALGWRGGGGPDRLPAGDLGERTHQEVDDLRGVGQRHRGGRHADLTVPVAEDDGGGVGMPCGSQVQVATAGIGQKHTIWGHVGHVRVCPSPSNGASGGGHRGQTVGNRESGEAGQPGGDDVGDLGVTPPQGVVTVDVDEGDGSGNDRRLAFQLVGCGEGVPPAGDEEAR